MLNECPRQVIGNLFEHHISELLDFELVDNKSNGSIPDFYDSCCEDYFECKSSYSGCVVTLNQLDNFYRNFNTNSYVFVFHNLQRIFQTFNSIKEVKKYARISSIHIIPINNLIEAVNLGTFPVQTKTSRGSRREFIKITKTNVLQLRTTQTQENISLEKRIIESNIFLNNNS